MRPIHVVFAHRDPALTDVFVRSVQGQFHSIATANSLNEIRIWIARVRSPLAIVDLELVNLSEFGELCREFPATAFIGIHRLADDEMWSNCLAMGAVDCCLTSDLPTILHSSDRYLASKETQAFSAA